MCTTIAPFSACQRAGRQLRCDSRVKNDRVRNVSPDDARLHGAMQALPAVNSPATLCRARSASKAFDTPRYSVPPVPLTSERSPISL